MFVRATRRAVLVAAATAVLVPALVSAQALEKKKVTIAVGGKNLLYYLPLTVAEQKGFFKDEGLDVEIVDFAGGAKALQAVVGGSADVVSGAFEHNINMQAKGQSMRAFVLQGRAPQIVLAVSTKTMPNFKSVADLKGKKIGVSAPGSSTNIMANYVLAKIRSEAERRIFRRCRRFAGCSRGTAFRADRCDLQPRSGDDDPGARATTSRSFRTRATWPRRTRSSAVRCRRRRCTRRWPSSKRIRTRVQALTNAIVRANKWIQQAGPSDIVKAVPESYLLGDRAVYIDAFLKAKPALSPDGMIPDQGPATALRALVSVDPAMANAKIDLKSVYTNEFVKKANAKYPNG